MASILYNSYMEDVFRGNIDMDTDTFYAMLVTSSYTPSKSAHTKRSDITGEVTGTGYTSGGAAIPSVSLTKDNTNNKLDIAFGNVQWASASITARGAVIYKRRGGAASADNLVGYVDFGTDVTASAATFIANFTSPLTIQN